MLSMRATKTHEDLYVSFIDYTKAFDKVQHKGIIVVQGKL